jgi:hypothetical protein
MVAIGFAKTRLRDSNIATAATSRGSGEVFGDKIQWLMQDGKPHAAIIRIWRNDSDDKRNDREVQELAIFKLRDDRACQYAKVNARQASATAQSEKLAIKSFQRSCPDPAQDRPCIPPRIEPQNNVCVAFTRYDGQRFWPLRKAAARCM